MRKPILAIFFLVALGFPFFVFAESTTFTTNPINVFTTLSHNKTGFETFANVTTRRLDNNNWEITVSLHPNLRDELQDCHNNLTGTGEGVCDLEGFKQRWMNGFSISNATLINALQRLNRTPITPQTGTANVSSNESNYLLGIVVFNVTMRQPGDAVKIGFGTITIFIPNGPNVVGYESAFDETTLTQDAGTGITLCTGTCINATNVSDNNRYATSGGDASDDAYFAVNWTIPMGNGTKWAFITMEGQQEDASVQCGLAIWNWTAAAWKAVNLTTCNADTDVTLTFNITNGMMPSLFNSSNNMIRTAFYTNNTAANTLQIDFARLQAEFNASVLWTNASKNDSDVFTSDVVNHSAFFNTSGTLSAYKFNWNATGASCDGGFANVTNSTFTGSTAYAYANWTIPSTCAGKTIGWNFWANNTDGRTNTTTLQTYTVSGYGWLNVSISLPTNRTNVSQNETFTINASIVCTGEGAVCGVINGSVRYNLSGTTPNTLVNSTVQTSLFPAREGDEIYLRPYVNTSLNSITNSLINGSDYDFNDTDSFVRADGGNPIGEMYYNYSGVGENATLFYTWDGTNSATFIALFNYTSGTYVSIDTGIISMSTTTNTTRINRSSGFISSDGKVSLKAKAGLAGTEMVLFDTYLFTDAGMPFRLSGDLVSGDSLNVSWVINYTGALSSSYAFDVQFNSTTYSQVVANNTDDRVVQNISIAPVIPLNVSAATSFTSDQRILFRSNQSIYWRNN